MVLAAQFLLQMMQFQSTQTGEYPGGGWHFGQPACFTTVYDSHRVKYALGGTRSSVRALRGTSEIAVGETGSAHGCTGYLTLHGARKAGRDDYGLLSRGHNHRDQYTGRKTRNEHPTTRQRTRGFGRGDSKLPFAERRERHLSRGTRSTQHSIGM